MATEYAIKDGTGYTRIEGFIVPDPATQAAPLGWTQDASNPANVTSNGGNLALVAGTLTTAGGIVETSITSGALPTVSLSSGVAARVSATRGTSLSIVYATDGTNNDATVKVELSPDNSTFSTLVTESVAAAFNALGAFTFMRQIHVPAGWYVKVTIVHATIGTCTYY